MDLTKPILIQGYGVNMFAIEQIERMLARGEVTPDRKFFQEGMETWVPLSELANLSGRAASQRARTSRSRRPCACRSII